jgi:DNA-binding GntR family transcriptional regulator
MGKPSRIEHIYSDLRPHLLAGQLSPGRRIDIEALSLRYGVSTMPIRLLLNRMVGERVVDITPHEGYVIPAAKERRVRDVHKWNKMILMLAIETAMEDGPDPEFPELDLDQDDIVAATEALFLAIADFSDTGETRYAVSNVNDRLRPLRQLDTGDLIDLPAEMAEFKAAWQAHDLGSLRDLVKRYHHRRLALVPNFVALAYSQ